MNNNWVPLTLTMAIQAMVSMALMCLPVMAPVISPELGISPVYLGVYIALAYAGAMLASLGSGAAVLRYGAIRVSQAGLLICALGLCLSAINSVPVMALGAVLIGMGYGPVTPASSHLLARTTAAHRMSTVFSLKQTGVPLGGALAGALVPGLLLTLGWQGALLAVAVFCFVCAVLSQPLRSGLDSDRNPNASLSLGHLAQPIRLVLSHRALAVLALCSFFFCATQLSLVTYLVTYLFDSLAYGLVAAGFALSVTQFAGMGGRVFWGWVADRFLGARPTLAVLAGLMALSSLAMVFLSPSWPTVLILLLLTIFGASAIGWNGVYLAEVAKQAPPGQASVATGGTLAVTFLGAVVGPPVFGALSGWLGSYRAGFGALAVMTLVCCVLLARQKSA
ncbi:MAG: MFS transporter [Burkholderiaceae bacterium]